MKKKRLKIYADSYNKNEGGGTTYLSAFMRFYETKGYEIIMAKPNQENQFPLWLTPFIYACRTFIRSIVDVIYFDVLIFKTNYIPSFTLNKNSLLIIDFPLQTSASHIDQFKLKQMKHIICNSNYTAKWIKSYWHVRSSVIYPPSIATNRMPVERTKTIINVGRFLDSHRSKRQHVLIDAFKAMYKQGIHDYTLKLIGYVQDEHYLTKLKSQATGYPIEFITDASDQDIYKLYQDAMFYWHACGYNIDALKQPALAEHYGIAIADAIAMGCIPLVYNNGGPAELVENSTNGEVWHDKIELVQKTIFLMTHLERRRELTLAMKLKSNLLTVDYFNQQFDQLIQSN